MSQRKELMQITYHTDDETGIYQIGEIDFSVSGEFDKYIQYYGRKGLQNILQTMCHLIWHVQEYGYEIINRGEK